jgi:hypothetical protein
MQRVQGRRRPQQVSHQHSAVRLRQTSQLVQRPYRVVQVVHRRVAEDDVELPVTVGQARVPLRSQAQHVVVDADARGGRVLARLLDHVLPGIDAQDTHTRPALRDHDRDLAGAAAEVEHPAPTLEPAARDQPPDVVHERPVD